MNPRVVVIGHGFTSRLSVIRSVAAIGCDVTVIVMAGYKRDGKTLDTKKPIDCYSKYVSQVYYCKRNDGEGLINLLLDKCVDASQKPILIPDTDHTAATIDMNQEKLKDYFLFPHINHQPGAVEHWMDKVNQKELAQQLGLNVASSTVIDIVNGKYEIPDGINYPCYSKPLSTFVAGKGGMRRCDNAKELASALDFVVKYRTPNAKILVEDYKEIETEYATLGFSDGTNVVIPGILQILTVSKQNRGIARQGKVMPVDGFETEIEKFKKLVVTIGFVGIFDIDFYKSDGVIYFCELNLRFGGSGYAFTKMGVNLPAMLVRHLRGESIEDMKQVITGSATYTNERMLMDDFSQGCLSLKEYNACKKSDICFVKDDGDPKPQKMYQKAIRVIKIKWCAKRIAKLLGLR